MPGKGVPTSSAGRINRDSAWVRLRAAVDTGILLKVPSTDLLAHKPCCKRQQRDGSSKSSRRSWGGTELSGSRARAGGTALSGTKVPVGTVVPLLSSSCPYKASRCRRAANLSLHRTGKPHLPHPGDSLRPRPIQIIHQPNLLQWLFLISGQPLLVPLASLKSPKGPQTPNKQDLASVHPVPLAEWPPAGHWWQLASVSSRAFPRCL